MHLRPRAPFSLRFTACGGLLLVTATATALRAAPLSTPATRTADPLTVDGLLTESAWATAPVLTGLRQFQPRAGEPMTENTEVRILYSEDFLYLGVRCHDRDPAGIVSRGMERDGGVVTSDHVQFYFDTFGDRRNGYAFAVSPDEGRWDALITNTFDVNTNWNGIWDVRCRTDPGGWTAEIAIPFKTLSFNPTSADWGFNFSRWIARKGEGGRWIDPRPEVQTYYGGNAGQLTGLQNISQGLGLQFTPYVLGRQNYLRYGRDSLDFQAGFDIRYRLTPGLNATFSYNTDFAETEVDQRQINFTRFPLFFPEKRNFFLEDSGIYRFADLNHSLVIPYYSRRIGLDESGQIVPILAAGKVTGRAGPYELGMTAAHLEAASGRDSQSVFAGRLSRQFAGESTIGFIGTAGDPNSEGDNYLGGVDLRFQNSQVFGDQTLVANAFALVSQTSPESRSDFSGHAVGVGLSYPGDTLNVSLQVAEISEGFDPALGFIERSDIRYYASSWRYLLRQEDPERFQWFSLVYANKLYTDLDNQRQTSSHSVYPLVFRLGSDDEFSLGVTQTSDRVLYPFAIPGGSIIPAMDYDMTNFSARLTFSDSRVVSGNMGTEWGDFYGGDWTKAFANVWWNPDKQLSVGVNYEWNHFDMPDATIDSQLVSAWLVTRFSPRARWSNLLQYDNISNTLGWNSRYSWEFQPGKNLNLVLNQLHWKEGERFQLLESELVAKAELTFRY